MSSQNETAKRRYVLLVDDEEGIRHLLEKRFIAMGWQVDVAGTGLHAVTKINSGKTFDLIICDYQMPAMSGLKFLEMIREKGNLTPLIMITGHPESTWLKKAGRLNLSGVLLKPFSHNDLIEKIGSLLGDGIASEIAA